MRFGSPGANSKSPSESRDQSPTKKKMNFLKEMKRHGIMKALNDISKFNEFFENSPTRKEDSLDPGETIKSDLSVRHETKKDTLIDPKKGDESELRFVFPFQRRARSLSPSKPSLINSIGNTSINNSGTFQPVVADPNFIIGGMSSGFGKEMLYSPRLSHPVQEKYAIVDEEMIAKGREVEEWLMGSGGSFTAATTGGSESMQGRSKEELGVSGTGPGEGKDDEEAEEEQQKTLEEWMYKTVVRPRQSKCGAEIEEE